MSGHNGLQKVGMGRSKASYTASAITAEKSGGTLEEYFAFLENKVAVSDERGFKISRDEVNPVCKPHQIDSIIWAVRGGCRAIFASFGLGKSIMQLEILRRHPFLTARQSTINSISGKVVYAGLFTFAHKTQA